MRNLVSATCVTAVLIAASACAHAQAPSPVQESLRLERAFPEQEFKYPLFMTDAGDGSSLLYVIEKKGVLRVFDSAKPDQPSEVMLDLTAKVSTKGNEEGLLGLAFHPSFKENGYLFVHYSSKVDDKHGYISRFQVSKENPRTVDPDSELMILKQKQPWRNHNGGMIEFGPDGFLYISFGDGGRRDDPKGSGQDRGTWLGALLRIDVNQSSPDNPYSVPKDNPFVGEEGVRPEIYAFGLRNVWRFSFDRKTNELWGADVGQDKWEEIDIITKGGNYGWNAFEGLADFRRGGELSHGDHIPPVAVYGRKEGISVTGGYVYRGERFPELQGTYLYGDYVMGNIWALTKQDDQTWQNVIALPSCGQLITSFAEDAQGEVYVLSQTGGIYRVMPANE